VTRGTSASRTVPQDGTHHDDPWLNPIPSTWSSMTRSLLGKNLLSSLLGMITADGVQYGWRRLRFDLGEIWVWLGSVCVERESWFCVLFRTNILKRSPQHDVANVAKNPIEN
jgi:hypothetical protein